MSDIFIPAHHSSMVLIWNINTAPPPHGHSGEALKKVQPTTDYWDIRQTQEGPGQDNASLDCLICFPSSLLHPQYIHLDQDSNLIIPLREGCIGVDFCAGPIPERGWNPLIRGEADVSLAWPLCVSGKTSSFHANFVPNGRAWLCCDDQRVQREILLSLQSLCPLGVSCRAAGHRHF